MEKRAEGTGKRGGKGNRRVEKEGRGGIGEASGRNRH